MLCSIPNRPGCVTSFRCVHALEFPKENVLIQSIYRLSISYRSCKTLKKMVKQSHYSPEQALGFPEVWGSRISRQSAHEGGQVVSPTHRPSLPPRKYSWYSFLLEVESTPGPQCARKNSSETIGDRTRDHQACREVPQPTAVRRAPNLNKLHLFILKKYGFNFNSTVTLTSSVHVNEINPLRTKRNPFYLKTQFVPRSKHLPSRL